MKGSYLRHVGRSWKQHVAMQFATLVVLTGTFVVVSISLLVHQNLDKLLSHWGDSVKLSVFMQEGATETQRDGLRTFLQHRPGVTNVQYISKDEAAKSFEKHVSKFRPNFELDKSFGNPLPSSFEVSFGDQLSRGNYKKLLDTVKELVNFKEIEDVAYGQGWVENYASLVSKFHSTSLFLIFILLCGSIFVVGNSIRTSVSQRRQEVEILELIGGTTWSIRGPYIFEGSVMGTLSAILAVVITGIIFKLQGDLTSSNFGIMSGRVDIERLNWTRIGLIIFLGGAFGTLGSFFSIRKICSGWAAARNE